MKVGFFFRQRLKSQQRQSRTGRMAYDPYWGVRTRLTVFGQNFGQLSSLTLIPLQTSQMEQTKRGNACGPFVNPNRGRDATIVEPENRKHIEQRLALHSWKEKNETAFPAFGCVECPATKREQTTEREDKNTKCRREATPTLS